MTGLEPHPIFRLPSQEQALALERTVGREQAALRVQALLKRRRELMEMERNKPFEHGYESPIWHTVDDLLCDGKQVVLADPSWNFDDPQIQAQVPPDFIAEAKRRRENGEPALTLAGAGEILITGSNRSSKSEYAGKKCMKVHKRIEEARGWSFADSEGISIARQQPILFRYLPAEVRAKVDRSGTGKFKEGATTKIGYQQASGFIGQTFVLPNRSQHWFKNYKQNMADMEGDQLDVIWLDELRDPELLKTLRVRLGDRNGLMIVTFTSIDENYTTILNEYDQGSATLLEAEAELLPLRDTKTGEILTKKKIELGKQESMKGTSENLRGGVESRHAKRSNDGNSPSRLGATDSAACTPSRDTANVTEGKAQELAIPNGSGSSAPPSQNPLPAFLLSSLTPSPPCYEKVPRVKIAGPGGDGNQRANIVYFHITDNPFYGYSGKLKPGEKPVFGKERFYKMWRNASRSKILSRVYGILVRARVQQFNFQSAIHRITRERTAEILRAHADASRYHLVDPCSGRNWFMIWACCWAPGKVLIYREWPSYGHPKAYIPGVGDAGPWAVPGKPADGMQGPAQSPFRFGLDDYKREILRLEGRGDEMNKESRKAGKGSGTDLGGDMVHKPWSRLVGTRRVLAVRRDPDGPEEITERWIDARYANAPREQREGTSTLIEQMAELEMEFRAMTSEKNILAANDGSIDMINAALAYDTEADLGKFSPKLSRINEPNLLVSEDCPNVCYALANWTGHDGQKGACKDPIDTLRGLFLSGLDYIGQDAYVWSGGGKGY